MLKEFYQNMKINVLGRESAREFVKFKPTFKISKLCVNFNALDELQLESMHALKNSRKLVINCDDIIGIHEFAIIIDSSLRILNDKINFPDEKRQDYPEHLVIDLDKN